MFSHTCIASIASRMTLCIIRHSKCIISANSLEGPSYLHYRVFSHYPSKVNSHQRSLSTQKQLEKTKIQSSVWWLPQKSLERAPFRKIIEYHTNTWTKDSIARVTRRRSFAKRIESWVQRTRRKAWYVGEGIISKSISVLYQGSSVVGLRLLSAIPWWSVWMGGNQVRARES